MACAINLGSSVILTGEVESSTQSLGVLPIVNQLEVPVVSQGVMV